MCLRHWSGICSTGTLTGLVLASQNPHVQFYIVDGDERLISAWNSDRVPISEPGVEELLFEDAEIVSPGAQASLEPESEFGEFVSQLPRARKLHNVTFSTNLHAGITPSDMVFLCLETRVGTDVRFLALPSHRTPPRILIETRSRTRQ